MRMNFLVQALEQPVDRLARGVFESLDLEAQFVIFQRHFEGGYNHRAQVAHGAVCLVFHRFFLHLHGRFANAAAIAAGGRPQPKGLIADREFDEFAFHDIPRPRPLCV